MNNLGFTEPEKSVLCLGTISEGFEGKKPKVLTNVEQSRGVLRV